MNLSPQLDDGRPIHLTHDHPWGPDFVGVEMIMTREQAFELLERAKDRTPADWVSWTHLSQALHISGDSETGLLAAYQAVTMHESSLTLLNLAVTLECFGRFDEALHFATLANQKDKGDQFGGLLLAQGHLRRGDWKDAWKPFEHYCWGRIWEVGLGEYIPQWEDEPLDGKKILVLQGGGFGDNMMFMRWFRDLKAMGAHITYACPDVMVPLLQGHPWIDVVTPTHEGPGTDELPEVAGGLGELKHENFPEETVMAIKKAYDDGLPIKQICEDFGATFERKYDYFVPIMGLARRCHATVKNTEEASMKYGPYITANPQKAIPHTRFFERSSRLNVGVCRMGAEKLDPRRHRSLNEEQIKKLLIAGLGSVNWVNLQYGMKFPMESDPHLIQPEIKDWSDTAAVIEGLDLVITVDTGVMHLAGAMGKETWVLLPGLSDWKFLLNRDDSPFYPSLRLFRNQGEGLEDSLAKVIVALEGMKMPILTQ